MFKISKVPRTRDAFTVGYAKFPCHFLLELVMNLSLNVDILVFVPHIPQHRKTNNVPSRKGKYDNRPFCVL